MSLLTHITSVQTVGSRLCRSLFRARERTFITHLYQCPSPFADCRHHNSPCQDRGIRSRLRTCEIRALPVIFRTTLLTMNTANYNNSTFNDRTDFEVPPVCHGYFKALSPSPEVWAQRPVLLWLKLCHSPKTTAIAYLCVSTMNKWRSGVYAYISATKTCAQKYV